MRLLLPASLLAFTLFLSGCFHLPQTPLSPPVNGNTPTPTTTNAIDTSDRETYTNNDITPTPALIPTPTYAIIDTSDWETYTNEEYGFEFRYPGEAKIYENYFSDSYRECRKQGLGKSQNELVDYEVFSGNQEFFLKEKFTYTIDDDGRCVEIENSFVRLQKKHQGQRTGWHIHVKSAPSQEALLSLLRDRYGATCTIGGFYETKHRGTLSVAVKSDGKDLGETECPVNYISYIKYSPSKKMVAYWDIGQECNITTSDFDFDNCLDSKIADSFKFLD